MFRQRRMQHIEVILHIDKQRKIISMLEMNSRIVHMSFSKCKQSSSYDQTAITRNKMTEQRLAYPRKSKMPSCNRHFFSTENVVATCLCAATEANNMPHTFL